jgi:hypothetical protein
LYEIISALRQSAIVLDVEVLELIDEDSVKLIKIKAILKENCLLYITELHTKDYQKYSYHYQKNDGDLIARWDNKPHWRDMSIYPHHKHENNQVSSSHRVTIADVLDQIEEKITVQKDLP